MANIEGVRRMKKVGGIFIVMGILPALLAAIVLGLSSRETLVAYTDYVRVILLLMRYLGLLVIAGVLLWVSGWIVDGFLRPRRSE